MLQQSPLVLAAFNTDCDIPKKAGAGKMCIFFKLKQKISCCFCFKTAGALILFTGIFFLLRQRVFAQPLPETPYSGSRLKSVIIAESAVSTIGLVGLNYLWYKKFPHSHFHFFNDSNEWLSMDKAGHATTAYNISNIQYNMMRWSGVKNNQAVWIGGLTALGFQTVIEVLDGFSQKWGFSVSDMMANIAGTVLFISQQFAFNDQRIQLKFSFHRTIFPNYNPGELGKNKWQRWLKDYNGQTYWLSVNPGSFMKSSASFPRWFNASFGYGAEGMTGAVKNPSEIDKLTVPYFKRYRQFYLSADVDLRYINNKMISYPVLLSIPQIIKLPLPAIEFEKEAPVKYHWLYF